MNFQLLPYKFKWIGMGLVLIGLVFAVLNFRFNVRIEIPVFSVVSTFVKTRFFVFSRTNFTDELILLFMIPGFLCIVFSKEKTEDAQLDIIRAKSLAIALIANSLFLLFSVLFIFGSSFMAVIIVNLISIFLFYLVVFNILKKRLKP